MRGKLKAKQHMQETQWSTWGHIYNFETKLQYDFNVKLKIDATTNIHSTLNPTITQNISKPYTIDVLCTRGHEVKPFWNMLGENEDPLYTHWCKWFYLQLANEGASPLKWDWFGFRVVSRRKYVKFVLCMGLVNYM